MAETSADVAAVVIGRNEGARLVRCLASLSGQVERIIYVDSGSTDNSVAAAEAAGAEVVALDPGLPFTAARGRNAGIERLAGDTDPPNFIQFVDGDCEVRAGWIETAHAFLAGHPQAAVVCGRRRERHPDATIWNRLIDAEWDTPVGETAACGGDAMMRYEALRDVGGFDASLIAGEEPELCLRLRRAGWTIWRIDAEMTLHDAAMTRFSQWWKRARRAGHAYAEGAAMHGAGPERYNLAETPRALLWGAGVPLAALLGMAVTPWAPCLLLLWPAQVLRLRARGTDWALAFFLTLSKLPEAQGVLGYVIRRALRMRRQLIEYK
jgi:GT2 family glycosyltransferase